jgi:hypothetical protein
MTLLRLVNRGLRLTGVVLVPAPPSVEQLRALAMRRTDRNSVLLSEGLDAALWLARVADLLDEEDPGWPRRRLGGDLVAIARMLTERRRRPLELPQLYDVFDARMRGSR